MSTFLVNIVYVSYIKYMFLVRKEIFHDEIKQKFNIIEKKTVTIWDHLQRYRKNIHVKYGSNGNE